MYSRRYTTRAPRRVATSYPTTYRKKVRRAQPALKSNQTRFERRQPTARTNRTAQQVQLSQTPIWPASKMIHNQLYYDYAQNLTGAAGLLGSRVYSANGIFDPDITGTGHQVIAFDQLMLAYEHYAVIRAKLTITFLNNASQATRCGVYLNPDAVPITDPVRLMENGLVKHITMDAKAQPGTGERIRTISIDCDVKKFFGKSKYSDLIETDYQGTIASNPVEQVYFVVFAYCPFSVGLTTDVFYDAILSYDVIYTEPRKLAVS